MSGHSGLVLLRHRALLLGVEEPKLPLAVDVAIPPKERPQGNTIICASSVLPHAYAFGTCPVKMRGSGTHGAVGSACQLQPADEVMRRRNVLFDTESNYQQP